MSTVDNMSTFSFSCFYDPVAFYVIVIVLLAPLIKRYGCGGIRAVVLPASIS